MRLQSGRVQWYPRVMKKGQSCSAWLVGVFLTRTFVKGGIRGLGTLVQMRIPLASSGWAVRGAGLDPGRGEELDEVVVVRLELGDCFFAGCSETVESGLRLD